MQDFLHFVDEVKGVRDHSLNSARTLHCNRVAEDIHRFMGLKLQNLWKKVLNSIDENEKSIHIIYRDTPEYTVVWAFGTNKLLLLKLRSITQINGKYIIHAIGHSIVNGSAPWSYNGKCLFVPPNPDYNYCKFKEFNP